MTYIFIFKINFKLAARKKLKIGTFWSTFEYKCRKLHLCVLNSIINEIFIYLFVL